MALKIASLLVAACTSVAAHPGIATLLPAGREDVGASPAVVISFEQDATHRLVVRYQAPADVGQLDFLLIDDRMDSAFRTPFMKPANDCGTLVPRGIALRHGAGCEHGAVFVVEPRAMQLDAMNEPAQPSSDGGVLFYTGYYAAAAPGLPIRWRFTPAAGDYGIDDSRRHDAAWQVESAHVYEGAKTQGDQRDDADWLASQHALHYVFLGHTPMTMSGRVLWVRDPAVPQAIVDTVGHAGPIAWDAYARATSRQPEGQTAIVVLGMPPGQFGYQGDRTEGQMLRLSFAQSDNHDAATASKFIAHETAHLWNHGVFRSDMARPWLHEGDAEWAALNATHDAGLLSDKAFVDAVQASVDSCLTVRGEHAAATLQTGWSREDDPYGCGVALQLLGFARVHAAHADATPLAVWGALHRAHPMLDAAGFAQFFDDGDAPTLGRLLTDDKTPFASSYRADLAAYLPLRDGLAEPAPGQGRRQVAFNLMSVIGHADCGKRLSFTLKTDGETGEFALDPAMACKTLPQGSHLTSVAGVPIIAQPRAAWRAVLQACTASGHFEAGFDGHAPVALACPASMPELPPQVQLPDDVLARLGLSIRAVAAASN